MPYKLHQSFADGVAQLGKLDNLYLESDIPLYSDDSLTIVLPNPVALELNVLADIRVTDRPTLTINDINGNEYYSGSPLIIETLSPAGAKIIEWRDINSKPNFTGWATKAFTDGSTTDVAEGSNQYFTNAKVKAYGDTVYPQLSVQYTNPTWLAGIDASTIKTGTIDLARLPAMPSANTIVCTTIPAMSAGDQLLVAKGTVVIESTTGNTYRYSGSGSVILNASYIQQSDMTPDWAVITNRPTNVSTWTNDAGYLTAASSLAWAKLTGVPATFAPSAHTHLWADLTDKPSTFTPSAHVHAIADTTGLQEALDAKQPTGDYATNTALTNGLATKQPTGAYITLTSPITGYVTGANQSLLDTDTILGAFGKIQTQLADKYSSTTSRAANTFLAAPNGSAGVASFRTIVAADIPALDWSKITTGKPTTLAGYGITDALLSTTAASTYQTIAGMSSYSTKAVADTLYQPLDSDLTAIAALTTTAYGRSVLTVADAAAGRALLGAQVAGSYALADHLHTGVYLLLTGGTLSGELTVNGVGKFTTQLWGNANIGAVGAGSDVASTTTVGAFADYRNTYRGGFLQLSSANHLDVYVGNAGATAWQKVARFGTDLSTNLYGALAVAGNVTGANLAITNWNIAYTHSQATGNPHGTTIADISGLQTAINGKQPLESWNQNAALVTVVDSWYTVAIIASISSHASEITIIDNNSTLGRQFIRFTCTSGRYNANRIRITSGYQTIRTWKNVRLAYDASNTVYIQVQAAVASTASLYEVIAKDLGGITTNTFTRTVAQPFTIDGGTTTSMVVESLAYTTPGTYPKVTVDMDGRVLSGSALVAADIPSLDWSKITTGKPTTLTGYGITDAQPLDADLTAIAALTTTAYGLGFLPLADAAAARTYIGAQAAGSYQPLDSDLTAIAALTTQTFGRSLLTATDAAAGRTLLASLPVANPTFTGGATGPFFIANQTQAGGDIAGQGARIALANGSSTDTGWIMQQGATLDKLQFINRTANVWTERMSLTNAGLLSVDSAKFTTSVKRGTYELWGRDDLKFGTTAGTMAEGNHTHDAVYAKLSANQTFAGANQFTANTRFGNASYTTGALGADSTGAGIGPYSVDASYGFFGAVNKNGLVYARVLVGSNGAVILEAMDNSLSIGGTFTNSLYQQIHQSFFRSYVQDVDIGFVTQIDQKTTFNSDVVLNSGISLAYNPVSSTYTLQQSDCGKIVTMPGTACVLPVTGISTGFWCILALRVNSNLNTSNSSTWYLRGTVVAVQQIVRGACVAVWDGSAWMVG